MSGFENDLKTKILASMPRLGPELGQRGRGSRRAAPEGGSRSGVTGATPFILTQVLLSTPRQVTGAVLRGLEIESARRVIILDRIIRTGSWRALEETGPGQRAAKPSRASFWARNWPSSWA